MTHPNRHPDSHPHSHCPLARLHHRLPRLTLWVVLVSVAAYVLS